VSEGSSAGEPGAPVWGPSTVVGPATPPAALPGSVRAALLALAAEALGSLDEARTPASLRAVRRFAPARRARAGARPLLHALAEDRGTRALLSEQVRAAHGALATALDAGQPPPDVAPATAAAAAWLLGSPDASDLLARAGADDAQLTEGARRRAASLQDGATRSAVERRVRTAEEAARRAVRERDAALAQVETLRRRLRPVEQRASRLVGEVDAARREALAAAGAAGGAAAALAVARARVAELAAELAATREAGRAGRAAVTLRARLLLDSVVAAAGGLRRELGLDPAAQGPLPGDLAAAALGTDPVVLAVPTGLGLASSDPALLDALLAVPGVHLVVDGYNVTKTGYGELTLAAQRDRLLRALAGLAARTGAEITVVFDGAGRPALSAPVHPPRGVRLAWSPPGVTADDVVLGFVSAEPAGRPLVVVSSDREVAQGAAARGARAVDSAALVARLGRA